MCDEEFEKYFEEETKKQFFSFEHGGEAIKIIMNDDYFGLVLDRIKRLESKIKMLENSKNNIMQNENEYEVKVNCTRMNKLSYNWIVSDDTIQLTNSIELVPCSGIYREDFRKLMEITEKNNFEVVFRRIGNSKNE